MAIITIFTDIRTSFAFVEHIHSFLGRDRKHFAAFPWHFIVVTTAWYLSWACFICPDWYKKNFSPGSTFSVLFHCNDSDSFPGLSTPEKAHNNILRSNLLLSENKCVNILIDTTDIRYFFIASLRVKIRKMKTCPDGLYICSILNYNRK